METWIKLNCKITSEILKPKLLLIELSKIIKIFFPQINLQIFQDYDFYFDLYYKNDPLGSLSC